MKESCIRKEVFLIELHIQWTEFRICLKQGFHNRRSCFYLFILHRLAFSLISLYFCHLLPYKQVFFVFRRILPMNWSNKYTRSIPILTDYLRALTKTPGNNHPCVSGNLPIDSIKARTNVRNYIFL